jgi:CubicO group peptidase (beta-lactamase class C family)
MFSNTKNITVVAALILYERGKFLLNDPIEKYLPFFGDMQYCYVDGSNSVNTVPVSHSIRIKDLFSMTSGLVYGGLGSFTHSELEKEAGGFLPKENWTTMEYVEQISKIPLAFDPGTSWSYGFSHDVLGALIEAISGKKFSEFLSDEIFKPLKMNNTSFRFSEESRSNLAGFYMVEDGGLRKDSFLDQLYDPSNKYELGGAGLLSTLEDMTRFTTMLSVGGTLEGNRILGRRTIDLMRQNHLGPGPLAAFQKVHEVSWPWFEGYGYGLGVRTLIDKTASGSNGSIGEFGWCGAAGSWIMIDPDEELAACYMHQLFPLEKNLQDYCHPRLRNVIYGVLD